MKTKLILLVLININLLAQTTVFYDNFNTSQGSSFVTNGQIGSSPWYVYRSGVDWGARIDNGILELTNDATSTATANSNGWVFSYTNTSSFASPFSNTLKNNTQPVNYIFNMRQIRPDPAGFSLPSYGVAFIIGSTSDTVNNKGNGYAIVLGQSGSTDPIRFVKFQNGLSGTLTNIITATSPLNDIGNEYLSLALRYDPFNDRWELYGRNDSTTTFGDPADGNLSFLGSNTDNTYVSIQLSYLGAYWQGSTAANQTAFFDNISVKLGNIALPVELTSLNILFFNNKIKLRWETATETNNYGFEIERAKGEPNSNKNLIWEKIGFVQGSGNSNSPKEYTFIDKDRLYGIYSYRLKQIDFDGNYSYSDALSIKVGEKPLVYDLKNYPNPFNPETIIEFELPQSSLINLSIYNSIGQKIETLVNEFFEEGIYRKTFNGSKYPSGVYFIRFQTEEKVIIKKIMLIK